MKSFANSKDSKLVKTVRNTRIFRLAMDQG